jgi:ABC-2 type transport system permease protein
MRKEALQVLRDRVMRVQILVPPIVQLLVVAQAMTFEVPRTDLALVDHDRSPASARLVERFTASGRFVLAVVTPSADQADQALLAREAGAVLRIPAGFGRALGRGGTPEVQLVLNAEDGAAAGVVQGYASRVLAQFARAEGRRGALVEAGMGSGRGIAVQTRTLYNPQGEYLAYMAIGLLASLVTLIGVLLTSQNVAREREGGTLEQLNVTPLTKGQFIAGKLAPFWVLGLFELTAGLLIIRWAFGVAFAGSLVWVYLGAAVYLVGALGLGLLISSAVATQQQAMFVTFFVLVTMLFLGGIFTPAASMPGWAQALSQANPIRHFVEVLRGVLMKGAGPSDLTGAFGAMTFFAIAVLPLAYARYQKTTS